MRAVVFASAAALCLGLLSGHVDAAPVPDGMNAIHAPAAPASLQTGPTPTSGSLAVVYGTPVTISSDREAFRGKAGTYTWNDVTVNPNALLIRWDARSTSSACTVRWQIAPSSGTAIASTIKVSAKKRVTGSKTVNTSSISAATITVKSTCPRWLITMGPASSGGGGGGGGGGGCDPNYSGYCVPIVSYDLNCADIRHSVIVVGVDIHRFDADGDGVGCESYG